MTHQKMMTLQLTPWAWFICSLFNKGVTQTERIYPSESCLWHCHWWLCWRSSTTEMTSQPRWRLALHHTPLRELPYMTSITFWDFLIPPPSLFAKSTLFVREFGVFLGPLPPSVRTSYMEAPLCRWLHTAIEFVHGWTDFRGLLAAVENFLGSFEFAIKVGGKWDIKRRSRDMGNGFFVGCEIVKENKLSSAD